MTKENKKYTCLIADDEPNAIRLIRLYLSDIHDVEVIAECADGFEALKQLNALKPEIAILDIRMPRLNGFEILEVAEHHPAVVFSTAYDEYAIQAFEANAADYLLKPYSGERFRKAILKAMEKVKSRTAMPDPLKMRENIPEGLNRIVTRHNQQLVIIPVDEIIYIEARDDYVEIHTSKGMFRKQITLNYLENHLDPAHFARIHRGYIVRLAEITGIVPWSRNSWMAVLKNGLKVSVSQSGIKILKEKLGI
ncbi:MAG: two-component system, LytTR family, response regulator [Bacteroidales bacterium]|jgi:two-component system LytT family response regulator|nr:two-component system, LytTR family, response regulator [Bacteroidales bacterium]